MSYRAINFMRASAIAVLALVGGSFAMGEDTAPHTTVEFESGGKLRAEVHPATVKEGETVILSGPGLLIELPKDSVEEAVAPDPLLVEYASRAAKTPDAAAEHFALSEWCHANKLDPERQYELQRTIAFDPDHEPARKALGYAKVEGKWVHPEQSYLDLGYVRYRGKWYSQSELDNVLANEETEKKRRHYLRDMLNWRHQVEGRPAQATEAILNFQRVQDPLAVFAVGEMLKDEQTERMRQVYVDVLGRIPGGEASFLLAKVAIEDPLEIVRESAINRLVERQANYVVPSLLGYLRGDNNVAINRAATVAGRLKDERAIPALIGALVTEHKQTITVGGGASVSPNFGSGTGGGGGGLSAGSSTHTVKQQVRNSDVLGALNAITGQNFQFDQDLWRRWYSDYRNLKNVDLRGLPR
jgi:hypothetical protein